VSYNIITNKCAEQLKMSKQLASIILGVTALLTVIGIYFNQQQQAANKAIDAESARKSKELIQKIEAFENQQKGSGQARSAALRGFTGGR
jgi:7,8-dihydro-6-hydroxymethylpterin-pyrophosphokinase